jgi:tetratricopeptide (TPR) repeat protein
MNIDPSTLPDPLRQKFPNLKPIKSPPSLMTMNGFGFGMYGKRDVDQETQTYVKTRCFCAIFIPLFAVGAYRVGDAGSRTWYFFGKESLSSFAKSWNIAFAAILAFVGLSVGWDIHTSSPEYRARQEITRAAGLMKSGEPLKAANIYRQQINGPSKTEARTGLVQSLEACLQSEKPQMVASAFRLLNGLPGGAARADSTIPEAFKRGLSLVEKFRASNPDGALDVFNEVAALNPKDDSVPAQRISLLKQVVTAKPDRTNRVVELAVAYEQANQLEESWKLLRPYQHRLGATEGARILGQKLLEEGNYAEAYELLFPYVNARLGKMRTAESNYTNTVHAISRRVIEDLQAGRGDQAFYDKYEHASKLEKDELVDNYVEARMRDDPTLKRALVELKAANEIVPVALDLGIVQLNRAQSLKDPADRKAELEAAEKTFLAIRGAAGETDEYRLFLGQVYYWLGKSKEGKQLFDELLASRNRAFRVLIQLAETLRSVGETADARALAEEAYKSAKTNKEKFAAASFRALVFKDDDDQIAWLEKADPDAAWVQIEVNAAHGKRELAKGNKTSAANYLRKAIVGYEGQQKSSAMLNNCGLACFDLYEATGNSADEQRGMALMEEAVAMDPGDSILLHNTMFFLIARSVIEVVHDAMLPEVLSQSAGMQTLSHLYKNDEERTKIYQELRQNGAMKKGLAYLDKALLLAPKDIRLYETSRGLNAGFRDLAELKKLQQRFEIAAPDLSEERRETLEWYRGDRDKESVERSQGQIRMLESLAQTPAVSEHLLSSEEVNISLLRARENLWSYGGKVDSQKMLETAADIFAKNPSSAARRAFIDASLFRAIDQVSKQSPEFAALVEQTRRALDPDYLVAFVLERGGPMAGLLGKNENVIKAIAMEKVSLQQFPSWATITQWAFLRNDDPTIAAQVAKVIKDNEVFQLSDRLEYRFNPARASTVLEQYWTQKLLGDEKQAKEIYQAALHDGVPLPPL